MAHLGVLPLDVLDALASQLNEPQSSLRLLRLPHPRTGVPSLFLPYLSPGASRHTILEVQSVAPTNARSWFLGEGEVVADGKLLLMTPMDPAFLLVPLLQPVQPQDGGLGNFRPYDDIIEDIVQAVAASPTKASTSKEPDPSLHISSDDLVYLGTLDVTRAAMRRICDVKEITEDITVYRFSQPKLLECLRAKASRLSQPRIIESSRTLVRGLAKDGLMDDGKEALLESGRLRAACDLLSQYLPPPLHQALLASYDFVALDAHLAALNAEILAEATAHAEAANASKKKKKGTAESELANGKRKAGAKESTGVQKLKKANITGMKSIGSFFGAPKK